MDSPDPKERTAPAAEADVLGEEARNTGTLDKLTGDSTRPAARGPSRTVPARTAAPVRAATKTRPVS